MGTSHQDEVHDDNYRHPSSLCRLFRLLGSRSNRLRIDFSACKLQSKPVQTPALDWTAPGTVSSSVVSGISSSVHVQQWQRINVSPQPHPLLLLLLLRNSGLKL